MAGRAAGAQGAISTQTYIERELGRIGLVPKGEKGYEQAIRTIRRRIGRSRIEVHGTPLQIWRDFVPIPWPWTPRALDSAQTIYAGVIGDSLTVDVSGRFVILSQPNRSVIPRVGPGNPLNKAAAVALVGLEQFSSARLAPVRTGLSAGLEGNVMMRATAPASLLITTSVAETLLRRPLRNAKPGDLGATVTGSIVFDDSVETLCCNVIAVLPGADAVLSGEYVAVSAHLDHIGISSVSLDRDSLRASNERLWDRGRGISPPDAPPDISARIRVNVDSIRRLHPVRRDSIFNGADDDGSGTVALLEIARSMRAATPTTRRSVLFVWHTAEELGNQGSTWFTDHPTVPIDSIVALLHLDMVGRGGAEDIERGGPQYLEVIGATRLSRQLGEVIAETNAKSRLPFILDRTHDSPDDPMHLYCRTDHFEYARYGVPAAFFTTGEHPDYHQVTDEVEYIDFEKLSRVARLIRDVTFDLANGDTRPVLDSAKPDPRAGCRG